MTAMKNFEQNEKLLILEDKIRRLEETISNYEEKCRDMELDDMIEEYHKEKHGGELSDMDGEAHCLHDYIAATNRMGKYFEDKIESLNKEKVND